MNEESTLAGSGTPNGQIPLSGPFCEEFSYLAGRLAKVLGFGPCDLQEVYDTERQLLYAACTRAREALLVTCVQPGSEFLDDMKI